MPAHPWTAALGALALLGAQALPAGAGDVLQRLDRSAFEAVNGSGRPIACTAQIAHWFSFPVGRAAPGGAVRSGLLSDPSTGTVFIDNGAGDLLPVETLWCGFEGRAWETRHVVPLARRRGEAPGDVAVTCTPGDGRLRCR